MYNSDQILYTLGDIRRQVCCIKEDGVPVTFPTDPIDVNVINPDPIDVNVIDSVDVNIINTDPIDVNVTNNVDVTVTNTDPIDVNIVGNSTDPISVTLPATSSDAFGRLRISSPLTLFDSSHRFADNGLWSTATATGGTSVFNANQGLIDLTVTAASGSSVTRETIKVFAYQPGKSLLVLNTFVMGAAKTGLTQRVGYYGTENGYYLEQVNNTVQFVERSSVTGSVVNTPVLQANWNGDKLDGTGPSGITLDLTKAQILWMDIEWLGVGSVRAGFVINGQFILCHTFNHANIIASTYITTASLPLRYEIFNTAGTTGTSTLKQICSTVISEGGYELRGLQQAVGTTITAPRTFAVAGTYYPIVGLRLKSTRLDAIAIVTAVSILGIGNGKNYQWRVVATATTTGGSWISAGADSAVEYNLTGTSVTAGRVLASGFVNSSNQGSPSINILKEALFATQLERNGLTGTAYEIVVEAAIDATGGTLGMYASMDWEEISR